MVMTGTIYRGSRIAAQNQAGVEVMCLECLKPTQLEAVDYSFDDGFGGVIDWKVETECCGTNDYRNQGCDGCGEMLSLSKFEDCLYCEKCFGEMIDLFTRRAIVHDL